MDTNWKNMNSFILVICLWSSLFFPEHLVCASLNDSMQQIDTVKFQHFEKLVNSEEKIPLSIINKFVVFSNPEFFISKANYLGKGVVVKSKYVMFWIKQGNADRGNNIFVTYDRKSHAQIDQKAVLYYCHNCHVRTLVGFAYVFEDRLIIKYYKPYSSRVMPNIDKIKIVKKEEFRVTEGGRFLPE